MVLLTASVRVTLSVVPRKSALEFVPALPVNDQKLPPPPVSSVPHTHWLPFHSATWPLLLHESVLSVSLSTPSAKPLGTPVRPPHGAFKL